MDSTSAATVASTSDGSASSPPARLGSMLASPYGTTSSTGRASRSCPGPSEAPRSRARGRAVRARRHLRVSASIGSRWDSDNESASRWRSSTTRDSSSSTSLETSLDAAGAKVLSNAVGDLRRRREERRSGAHPRRARLELQLRSRLHLLAEGRLVVVVNTALASTVGCACGCQARRPHLSELSTAFRWARFSRASSPSHVFYYMSRLVACRRSTRPTSTSRSRSSASSSPGPLLDRRRASGQVRQELVAGTFERFVVSPFGSVAAVVSMTTFPFLLALASGLITIALAALVFGMPMHWSTVPLGIPLALLGCLSFIPFGVLRRRGGDSREAGPERSQLSRDGHLVHRRASLSGRIASRLDPVDVRRAAIHADGRAPAQRPRRHAARPSPSGHVSAQDRPGGSCSVPDSPSGLSLSRYARASASARSSSTDDEHREHRSGSGDSIHRLDSANPTERRLPDVRARDRRREPRDGHVSRPQSRRWPNARDPRADAEHSRCSREARGRVRPAPREHRGRPLRLLLGPRSSAA